jgi:hypothetical protein
MLAGTTGSLKVWRPNAFRAALHAAFARQQKNVVVVEDFHGQVPVRQTGGALKQCAAQWLL